MTPTPPLSRLWFTFMAGPNSLDDLRELWEPIRHHFSGLVVTYHGDRRDAEALYLEDVKGEGAVIYLPYSRRHSFSRCAYLYCGPIQDGDWCVQHDTLERLNPVFLTSFVIPFLAEAERGKNLINVVYYYGKVLLYQFHESLRFQGSPHEGLLREDGQMRAADITHLFPVEADARYNVRPLKRPDPFHFIDHYGRYWLHPWGSNHCLLGWEDRRDQLPAREARRLAFRQLVRARGYPVTLDGVLALFTDAASTGMDDELKAHINSELIVNNLYRYHVLGDRDISDKHDVSSIKPI